jgi:hypothetical protein
MSFDTDTFDDIRSANKDSDGNCDVGYANEMVEEDLEKYWSVDVQIQKYHLKNVGSNLTQKLQTELEASRELNLSHWIVMRSKLNGICNCRILEEHYKFLNKNWNDFFFMHDVVRKGVGIRHII